MAWLASVWDSGAPSYSGVNADLFALPVLLGADEMVQSLQESPRARKLATMRALRDAELQLAQSRSTRDVLVDGGVRYLRELDDAGIVVALRVPLGTSSRSQGAVDEARAVLEQGDALFATEMSRTRSILIRYCNELTEEHALFESLRDRVMPELETALEGSRTAYETGRYGYLELANAQMLLTEAQGELISAAERYHELLASIEHITGQPLARLLDPAGANK